MRDSVPTQAPTVSSRGYLACPTPPRSADAQEKQNDNSPSEQGALSQPLARSTVPLPDNGGVLNTISLVVAAGARAAAAANDAAVMSMNLGLFFLVGALSDWGAGSLCDVLALDKPSIPRLPTNRRSHLLGPCRRRWRPGPLAESSRARRS